MVGDVGGGKAVWEGGKVEGREGRRLGGFENISGVLGSWEWAVKTEEGGREGGRDETLDE